MPALKPLRAHIITLAIVAFVTYFFSFGNAFVWDDEQFIYKNEYVKSFNVEKILSENMVAGAGVVSNYYRPLTTLSFALDYVFWGNNPVPYHVVNTLLHIGAGISLFLLLILLGVDSSIAFFVALGFLIHPIQTEAVTYINSRGDSLFAFLGLCGLALYAASFKQRLRKVRLLISFASVTCFVMGLFAKEIGLAVGGLYFLVYLWMSKHKLGNLKILISKTKTAAAVLATVAVSGITYLILRATVLNFQNSFNFYEGQGEYARDLSIRLLTFTKIIWIYLRLLIIPFPLHMERYTNLVVSPVNPFTFATLLLGVGLVLLGFYEFRKTKQPLIWFGTAWFAIMIAPVSGIIPINGLLYEHWLYLPLVGFLIVGCGTLRLILRRFHALAEFLPVTLMFLSLVWILLTLRQNYLWGNPIRFYSYTLRYTDSARLRNNLAMAYDQAGQIEEAITEYRKAIELSDVYPQTHHNLGLAYLKSGALEAGEQELLKAIAMDEGFSPSYQYLLELYQYQQRLEDALKLQKRMENITR